jgi:tetratricopeptide (TPR) repeat protein
VLITLIGCNKSTTFTNSSSDEYLYRFSQALISNDENFILSTIIYMDNLIESGDENKVRSIYYNKAQLLYKIKQYNKALETLYQTDDSAYDVQKASLLILLGYQNQAMQLLKKATATNKKILIETSLPEHQKTLVLQGLVALYILADKHIEPLFEKLVVDKIITSEEAYTILQYNTITKEALLNSMWPR